MPQKPAKLRSVQLVLLSLALILLVLVVSYAWLRARRGDQPDSRLVNTAQPYLAPTSDILLPSALASSPTSPPTLQILSASPSQPPEISGESPLSFEGSIILAIGEGDTTHLFAYQPNRSFVRLTDGPWQDITPAISPDGSKLAFASNCEGYWDLYLMDLNSGVTTRLTDSPEYEASPTWSPDGLWLVFESYVPAGEGGNLELFIRPVDGSQAPIRLTDDPGADFSPAWSPMGRQVAFISTRSGENEVWLADLDRTTDRFQNISRNVEAIENHPAWSPDGKRLSWSSTSPEGIQEVVIWDRDRPMDRATPLNNGDWSAWSPQGDVMMVTLQTPNRIYLTGYSLRDKNLALPILSRGGQVEGITWCKARLAENLPAWVEDVPQGSPAPLWSPQLVSGEDVPGQRMEVVPLEGVEAPYPMLQDRVDESYWALRAKVAAETGWDFLSTLEQAYIPLTSPLGPGMQEDWLYTARAFRFNAASVNAGWVKILRQDYGSQTYWRIYLRTLLQDGSQGSPMKAFPWDFQARYSGEPLAYEQGGSTEKTIPSGYWLDFTQLALAYGWERLPALTSWITAYSSARYNEFALRDGLDWFSAMLEVYPREALNTPTRVSSPTPTSTASNTPLPSKTSTRTPYLSRTPTNTPTPYPTKTKPPTNTPWPTITRPPTNTPRWTPTPEATLSPTPQPY